ncbi:hypothetical protein K435DRAFT_803150 [Dendrothele bispora CBS 962.96]|uniref:Uncharacterized protein n=1 Tax=Dendrothele bispora (strain CBS 962.96) TaxID=1314807 RepID=A0A4S8LIK8_DENBC|nr:hypothetical protein K435DRAFT_803150 [Dendrothele bispora CBS 962.96]
MSSRFSPYEHHKNPVKTPATRLVDNDFVTAVGDPYTDQEIKQREMKTLREAFVQKGIIATFYVDNEGEYGWRDWSKNLGEYSINNLFALALAIRNGLIQPPNCLHLLNPSKEASWSVMELVIENDATGHFRAYFRPSTHECVRIGLIAHYPVVPVKFIQDEEPVFLSTSCRLWQTDIEMQLRKEILDWDMLSRKGRYYRPVATGVGVTGTKKKQPSWWNVQESSGYFSFYDLKTSEERKQSGANSFDYQKAIYEILENAAQGVYLRNPTAHPAYDLLSRPEFYIVNLVHRIWSLSRSDHPSEFQMCGRFSPTNLVKSMTASSPAGNVLTFENPAMSSPIAQAWLKWDSRGGVTCEDWVTIATAWQDCPECSLLFSFDGAIIQYYSRLLLRRGENYTQECI